MKKIISFIIVILMFCSCSQIKQSDDDKFEIVCTVFPAYDWIREIAKNTDTEITLIPSNGTDIHSYQPTAEDIIKISECDLFVYASSGEKVWYDDILKPDTEKINIVKVSEDYHENDEHIWMSLDEASEISEILAKKISLLNKKDAKSYLRNAEIYIEKLEELDDKYENTVDNANKRIIIVADRFPFHYLTDEYNVKYFAAFEGCTSESEVSFETITKLANKAEEYNIKCLLTAENCDNKIARAVINNLSDKNVKILVLNSMQSVSFKELDNISYISVMEENLNVLKEALD